MENSTVLEKNSNKKYQCEHGKRKYICVICHGSQICLHNIDVNFAGHLNFVLMEEENQVVRTVVEEITVNTAKKKTSASFAVDLKYVLTTDRNPSASFAVDLKYVLTTDRNRSVFFVVVVKYVLTTDRNHHVKNV